MRKIKIDLFSDTNTEPTPGMRRAMCEAAVGNEVAGEDPTVNLLLEKMCELLGKEAAIFLPSGTMCNGIAYRVWCERTGDLIILDQTAHPLKHSAGLISGLAHAQPYPIQGKNGIFSAQQIESILSAPQRYNHARPRVVSVEQTTNFGGGAIWPLQIIEEVCQLARHYKVYTHLDGARLFNAVVETGISAERYAQYFDSVWVDFSKSPGAPFGAVLAGSRAFIDSAWYYKFQQGGGLHQAGILAAGCLYGLEHHLQKLPEVHARTKQLARLLSQLSFIALQPDDVQTNIIILNVDHDCLSAFDIQQRLLEKGIRALAVDPNRLRMIVHLDISQSDVQTVFTEMRDIGKDYIHTQ